MAPVPSRWVLMRLDAESFSAKVTCASLTRKMRFQGSRNFACFSPKVRVEIKTSFWNSRRDSRSASLSSSSMRRRKRRRPTSMCALAASESSSPSCARKLRSASGSHPCTGSSPMGMSVMRYASYSSVTASGHCLDMSPIPNLLPMASTSAFVMVSGSRPFMPFHSALGAADTRFLSAVAQAAAPATPRPAVSTTLTAVPPTRPPTPAPSAMVEATTTAYAATRAPPSALCCCSSGSMSFSNW
mmetsp:Transcript_31252/g.50210  ORF Transcript_31252/g.50210 Transcript_31252/m.50210 type:complete len:243 (-) Transcript_31252:314-1042(-)